MDIPGQNFERDALFVLRDLPEIIGTFVHGYGVSIHVPGPQRHTRRAGSRAQVLLIPRGHGDLVRRHPASVLL